MKIVGVLITILTLVIVNTVRANHAAFPLEEATITSIHHAILQKKISCAELITQYLTRIKLYNLSNEAAPINAITTLTPDVLEKAEQLDKNFAKTKQLSGPLHCIPVIVKDNIDSYDTPSTAGTLALIGNQPNRDAFLVAKLRQAGAIILAKSSMDELAAGMFGISTRSGRIGNVYNTAKNPGGSSGGTAAAISANFAVIGIGTDNSGSVLIPAAFNGVYGLRPSTGLISQRGIFPAGNLDGTAGPIARSVEDLARTLDIIAQKDSADNKTNHIPREITYVTYLNKEGLQGKRIGIVHQVGKIDTFRNMPKDVAQLMEKSWQFMSQSGAVIINPVDLPNFITNREFNMAGMRQDIDNYLASYPATRKSFQDICESNRARAYGNVRQCQLFIQAMPVKFGAAYQRALTIFAKNKQYVEKIMRQYQLDALFIPISTVGVATYDASRVNTWQAPVASNAGLPAITINLGYMGHDSMPVGVELVGKKYSEGRLIEMAYAYEQKTSSRVLPNMPEKNQKFNSWDIPKYNNLLTEIGMSSYTNVLKNSLTSQNTTALSAEKFRLIVKEMSD